MTEAKELARLKKEGSRFVKQARKLHKKHGDKINPSFAASVEEALKNAEARLQGDDAETLQAALNTLDERVDKHLGKFRKSTTREYVEAIGFALLFALVLRAFFVEAFIIPSASMEPTLQEGDRLFVNKLIYGVRIPFMTQHLVSFSAPERGDVVVFIFPRDEARAHTEHLPPHRRGCVDPQSLIEEKDYIKRVVALPGDHVKLVSNVVHLNGSPIDTTPVRQDPQDEGYPYLNQQVEKNGDHIYTTQNYGNDANFGLTEDIVVKPGHVLVFGDNRDNSSDGRCWGQVPVENIKGKAMFIWLSSNAEGIQWDRIGKWVD